MDPEGSVEPTTSVQTSVSFYWLGKRFIFEIESADITVVYSNVGSQATCGPHAASERPSLWFD